MGIKQGIKKCLAIGVVSILAISPIFADSDEDSVSRILSIDQVIEKAISKEEKVSVLNKQINAYKEKLNNTWNIGGMTYYTTKYSYDQALLEQATLEDKVAYKVIQIYESIILLEKQIKLNNLEIKIAQKELQAAKIKNNKGQLSNLGLSQAKLSVDNKIVEKKKNELMLSDYKMQLFSLASINLDDYEKLEEDLNYETLGDEEAIHRLIMKNVDYYMQNTEAYVAYQDDHMVEALEYKYGSMGVTMEMWESNKADLAQNSYQVVQQRKQMVESLQTTSVELKKLEEMLVLQEQNISQMQEELKTILIRYNKGYVSELEKQKAEQNMYQLELSRMQNIYTYKQLKTVLEKPWVKY